MKNIKILLLGILTIFLISCGSNNSTTSNTAEIDGFWQDLDEDKLTLFQNNSMYTYTYYKDKVHGAGGDCYSRYKRAVIESNATEPTILNYTYYDDRFSYSGPINIVLKDNELKFLIKYDYGVYRKNEVIKQYEKMNLSESDIDMCNFADRLGGITDKGKMAALWKLQQNFKFEPYTENVEYWLISDTGSVTSLIYNQQSACYGDAHPEPLFTYFFVNNIYKDGRLNLIYSVGTAPGLGVYTTVLASIVDNMLTLYRFDNNDISNAIKVDRESIKMCQ